MELLGPDAPPVVEQELFERRLEGIARSIVSSHPPAEGDDQDRAAALLATLVLNYAATVWLTWCCMPTGSDDLTATQHDLTDDEAQLGVLSLVQRVIGPDASPPGPS